MKKIFSVLLILMFILMGCTIKEKGNLYTLPDLSNKSIEEAKIILRDAPITIVYDVKVSEIMNEGLFVSYGNDLEANDSVSLGSVIYIYFAKASETKQIQLPDLSEKNITEIVSIMNSYHLNVTYEFIERNTVEHNLFISYGDNLTSDSYVDEYSTITINISKNEPVYVQLPDLTGMSQADIEILFNTLDVLLVFEEELNYSYDAGEFIRYQNLQALDFVEVNSRVVVILAKHESTSTEIETYYQDALGLRGEQLKSTLNDIIDNHHELSYSQVWDALMLTDEDPSNSNNVLLLYTGWSIPKSQYGGDSNEWNREHVWPKSHGDFGTSMGAGTDLHHLRPTDVTVNSSRGDRDFDIGGNEHGEALLNYFDQDSWEPRDEVKGDIARMLFYMCVRYEGEYGEIDLELVDYMTDPSNEVGYLGKLSILLDWHALDPVDDYERSRNEIIFSIQNNRNPFIDYPDFAYQIWDIN